MNYGFHLATTGVITGMRRLDTIANNLANSTTVGYKADRLTMSPRSAENVERPGAYADANAMLDALGGGTLFLPNAIDLRQGTLRQTGSPLDVALEGDGFFRLEVPASSATRSRAIRQANLFLPHQAPPSWERMAHRSCLMRTIRMCESTRMAA
jgi:flagellar basal-body rod protein FlgG